ncbi:gamma-glutamylcyclotransferase [Erythrobacter sp. 3-20A1M]|uniref:gamma-glutamylcyclotransferase family protein n=1 Tax=Erythrobacter sp. 3-20A1M TaxID=2653850 RepID=UPI001BFC7C8A|nr:gamma-glutamylcyclotransferase family protein [Erythrobacter sp. 3-20A1M]QWC56899.1 gamma-glutamylcyclotransferase [Erythrobacter sp. 3-20A1M]
MRLFLYGVLLGDIAQGAARRLADKIDDGFPAVATGRLYVVEDAEGPFPAFVPDPAAGPVRGMVHEVEPQVMATIDIFERAGEDYDRRSIPLYAPDGTAIPAGAYCWRGPVEGLERIEHGDFARWLDESGRRPYGA